MEYMRERIKHEMKASKEIGMQSDEHRKQQIQSQNRERVESLRKK